MFVLCYSTETKYSSWKFLHDTQRQTSLGMASFRWVSEWTVKQPSVMISCLSTKLQHCYDSEAGWPLAVLSSRMLCRELCEGVLFSLSFCFVFLRLRPFSPALEIACIHQEKEHQWIHWCPEFLIRRKLFQIAYVLTWKIRLKLSSQQRLLLLFLYGKRDPDAMDSYWTHLHHMHNINWCDLFLWPDLRKHGHGNWKYTLCLY